MRSVLDGAARDWLGRYELCGELDAGGMARVYLARIRGPGDFDRLVAIKRVHPHLADQQSFVEMFLDEARIASQITHPNVCPVLDFGEVDGSYFIAMEYLFGETMGRIWEALRERAASADLHLQCLLAARVVAGAAEGLHAAHELVGADGTPLHVVHRDP